MSVVCRDGTCGNAAPDAMGPGYCPRCTILSRTPAEWLARKPDAKVRPTCPHRGEPTGERVTCSTCSMKVQLIVFACAKNGRCVAGQNADGIAVCNGRT